jgi:hypothetical protein
MQRWTITMPSAELRAMQSVDVTLEMIRRMTHAIDDVDALDSFRLHRLNQEKRV